MTKKTKKILIGAGVLLAIGISLICILKISAKNRTLDNDSKSGSLALYNSTSVLVDENFVKTNSEITSAWTEEDWQYLSMMSQEEKEMYLLYLMSEPKVSEMVKGFVADSTGYMAGFENRCKTPHSLYNKLYMRPQKMSIYEADDVLRYTLILSEDLYTSTAKDVISCFLDNGWHTNYIWNAWLLTDLPYQGVNVSLISDDGLIIEIQFHTEKSFEVKNSKEDHELYEKRRVLEEGSEEYNKILEQQKTLYKDVVVPADVEIIIEDNFKID